MNSTEAAAWGSLSRPPRSESRGIEALYTTGHWLLSQDRPADAACVLRAMALVAPTDDRSWLALGACHEAMGQPDVALQMYGTGRVLAAPSVRCDLARARILRSEGRTEEADQAVAAAIKAAEAAGDEELRELVWTEGRRT